MAEIFDFELFAKMVSTPELDSVTQRAAHRYQKIVALLEGVKPEEADRHTENVKAALAELLGLQNDLDQIRHLAVAAGEQPGKLYEMLDETYGMTVTVIDGLKASLII